MKKGYPSPQLLCLLFLFIGTCSFAQQITTYQLNHQEIDVDPVKADRYLFDMAVSESIISLHGLQLGDHYELLINPYNIESDCAYQIDAYSVQGTVEPLTKEPNEEELSQSITFRATSSTEMFHVSNNGCTSGLADQAVVSLLNSSCVVSSEDDRNPVNMSDLSRMAVLAVDYNFTITQLIEDVFIGGGCFDIANVQLIGNTNGVGHFSAGAASVILEDGVILASGNITNAPGPNNSNSAGTILAGADGDPDLALLGAGTIFDACGIEFDFTPTVEMINFEYVFASEEYCEFVGSTFNDVFGFFISGPGISGPFTNGAENIALIPGTTDYVAINSVNHNTNTAYFNGNQNNCNGVVTNATDIQYDGYTTVLTATANVIACETYHIRMVVSDVGDQIYDSGVFLGANSFSAGGLATAQVDIPGYTEGGVAYEGCSNGFLVFERDEGGSLDLDFIVEYEFDPASTATNGVDFSNIPNPIIIPAGQSSVSIPFIVFQDNITEGVESIILVLDNPCSCDAASIEILIDDLIPLESSTEDLSFCNEASVTIGPDVTGGSPEYTYIWSTGAQTPTIDINQNFDQTFYVTVTDICGSMVEDTIDITVIPEPTAEIVGTAVLCGENPTAFLEVTFTGVGPWEFFYLIDGTIYGPIITSDNPYQLPINEVGTYELQSVVSGNACEGTVGGTATVEESGIDLLDIPVDLTCANAADGTISILASGGLDPYTYLWNTSETTETITGLGAGTYTVTVTDANGCTEEITSIIEEPPLIELIAIPISEADCFNPSGGGVDLSVSGGTPGYIYQWDNGEVTEDLNGFPAGTYSVTVTDINACTEETVVAITENIIEPTANATGGVLDCIETEVNITGSGSGGNGGSVSYLWLDGNGNPISNSGQVLVNMAGPYIFVVTDDTNGCTAEVMVEVTETVDLPTPDAIVNGVITCSQGMVTIDGSGSSGSGPISYQWLDSSGNPVGNGPTINVTESGGYILIVTDGANGCSDEIIVDVPENIALPIPQIDPPEILDCNITSTTIFGSGSSATGGSTTLEWFDGTGSPLGGGSVITVDAPGIFILVVTDDTNGCTNEAQVVVTEDITPPPVDALASGILTCSETFITLSTNSGTNGNQFEWYGPTGNPLGSDSDIIVTETGTYSILVTGFGNGCTAEMMIPVEENVGLPVADAGADAAITCASEFATLIGSGSSTNGSTLLEWYDAGGVLMGTGEILEVTDAGTYVLVVTDPDNGCTGESLVTVISDAEIPNIEIEPPLELTCINEMSTLSGSTDATGNIQVGWYDELGNLITSNNEIDVNVGGVYTYVVTNLDNECSAESSVLVVDLIDIPVAVADPLGELSCEEITVILDGSFSSPFGSLLYEWIDPNGAPAGEEPVINATEEGTYTLNITNFENGCTATIMVDVTSIVALPEAVAVPDGIVDCNGNIVLLDGSGSSGGGTLSYAWFDGATPLGSDETQQVVGAGTYTLIITDLANGCTAETPAVVEENLELPIPLIDASGLLDCITEIVTLDGSGSSGSGTIGLEWFDPTGVPIGTGNTVDANTPGTYTLIVTNGSTGCTAEIQGTVGTDEELPAVTAAVDGPLTCENQMANLTGSGTAENGGPLTYQWLDPSGTPIGTDVDISVEEAGTYTFVVTNGDNGCTAEMPVSVSENILLPESNAGPIQLLTCDVTLVSLDGTASSSGNNISYEWTNADGGVVGTTTVIQVDQTGTYTLLVTNTENGCTALGTTTVEPDTELPMADAGSGAILDCQVFSAVLDGSASSSGTGISYQWLDQNGTPIGSGPTVDVEQTGIYTLLVSDESNGCVAESQVLVTDNLALPFADAGQGQLLTCDVDMVSLNGSNSTVPSGQITYEWVNAGGVSVGTESMINVTEAGTYQLLITGENGCTDIAEVTVLLDVDIPIADAGPGGDINCLVDVVMLGGAQTTTGNTISYEWINASGTVVATTPTFETTDAGIYTLTVFDTANDCNSTSSVEVAELIDIPTVDPGPGGILTCNLTEIILGGNGTTSGPNITYTWTDVNGVPLGSDDELMVTAAGTYTLTVNNGNNGCNNFASVTVDENELLPQADAGPNGLLTCLATAYTLDGTASSIGTNISYSWYNAAGLLISEEPTYEVTVSGDYTLVVNDANNGCSSSAMVTVTPDENAPVAIAAPIADLNCDITEAILDGSSSLTNSGALDFEWVDASGNTISSTDIATVTEPGSYTLTVTDLQNFCEHSVTVEVAEVLSFPISDAGDAATITCDVSVVQLMGSGSNGNNLTYEWLNPNGVSIGNAEMVEVSSVGTYTFVVTDMDSGCSTTATTEVAPDANLPAADAGPGATLDCNIQQVSLTGSGSSNSGNMSFEWLDPNGLPISNLENIDVNTAGVYTLIITDNVNSCTAESLVEVVLDDLLPVVDQGPDQFLDCEIDQVILTTNNSTAVSYEWTDQNGNVIGNSQTVSVSNSGQYQIALVGANGCANNAIVIVSQDATVPTADPGPNAALDCNIDMVSLGGLQTSSGPGITYEWLDANNIVIATTPTIDVDNAGIYTLVVYNSNNDCESIASVQVLEDIAIPTVDPGIGGTLTCSLSEVLLGGGNTTTGSDIEYIWADSSGNVVGAELELSVIDPGTYTLTVNNNLNNCSDFASVTVGQNIGDPLADAGPSDTLTCEITSIMLNGSNSSTGNNIQYSWYDDQGVGISNNVNITVTSSGIYTLDVLDVDNGCMSTAQVVVVPDENLPSALVATPDELTCTVEEVLLSGLGSSSVSGDLIYEWEDASNTTISNTEEITVNAPGIYTLNITDPNNGCTDAINVEVPQDINDPSADAGEAETLTCAVSSVMLSGSGTGNNLSYEWFDQNDVSIGNAPSVDVASAGLYTLVVTDGTNGCDALSTVTVVPDDNLPVADANVAALLTCEVDLVQINGNGSSTGTNISYEWSNEQGQPVGSTANIDVTTPGLYTLVVYDASNDCSAQTTVLVEENEEPPSPDIIALGSSEIDCINALVVLDAGSSTPTGNLEFQWSTSNGNILGSTTSPQIEANEEGLYTLVVVNTLNGCLENTDFEITIDQSDPTVNVAAPPVLTCVVSEFQLNGNGSSSNGNFTYNWTGNINSGQGTLTPDINTPGTYTLLVTNEDNGCTSEETVTVLEDTVDPDAAAATGDNLDCITEVVNLNGTGSSQGSLFDYEWTGPSILTGAAGLSPSVNAPGSYQLVVTNTENGCTEIAITEVLENEAAPTAAALLPEPPLCQGEAGTLSVVSITGGTPPYTYSIDNGNTFYPDSSFVLNSGNYDVLIQDATGCEFQQSIYIPDVAPVAVLVNEPVIEIQLGAEAQLLAVTNIPTWAIDTIMWTPTDSLSCTNCLNPYANPTESTTYEVTVINENGCEDKAQIRLDLDKDRKVYIPNAFSPNGDGSNDLFMIFATEIGIERVNYFQVYNRWGEMVFHAEDFQPNDPAYGWGGWFRGELMNPAVFVFWAEVEFVDGYKQFFKGDVTLLK
jgi:gliding motility-associated-like protein